MGRTLEDKQAIVAELKESLSDAQLAIVIDYQGLTVSEITDLRRRLRPTGTDCKVTKNTLMRIAVEGDPSWEAMTQFCKESSAFLLLRDDIGGAVKAYQDFQKATKKTTIRGGVMEGRALSEDDIKAVTELPSKEQLMAQIAGALNVLPTKLAVSLNAVPKKVAVGIREVPSSLVRAIKAVSEKEDAAS
ncbi:MAG: 50S ribosomal protein L10 [Leptolyngbyaceae cyanobacterium SL_7_1]|nr:50S ribosomal protein L10 [Leptolyngbyaceae cyanobacterium SL_7_1]